MIVRLSAYTSLVLGVWGALAVLSVWGAGGGVALGAIAMICGWAALSERPSRRVRRVARIGFASGVVAVVGFLVLLLLAALGV